MAGLTANGISALIQVQGRVPDAATSLQSISRQQDSASQAEAREAADKFESLLIHNMLKSMRKTTMEQDTSNQRSIFNDMLDQKLADEMIKSGGLGIADQLMNQLHNKQGDGVDPAAIQGLTQGFTQGLDQGLDQGLVQGAASNAALNGNSGDTHSSMTRDRLRLRELAQNLGKDASDTASSASTALPPTSTALQTGDSNTALERLRLISGLWDSAEATAQKPHKTKAEFLDTLAPHAQRSAQRLGTSPSAVLAIAALETGWGKSVPKDEYGYEANNYFGIKATGSDPDFTRNTTTEYLNGQSQNVEARFKSYASTADSVDGFADFLLENPRYSTALQHAGNPERFITELHHAGYATDPRYAEKAITVMRQVEEHTSQP